MKTLLGSARWDEFDGDDWNETFNGRNIGLGSSRYGKNGTIGGGTHRRHFLSVAPTRSGKGVSLIIPNLLYYQGSVIVIDPKGENAYITAKRRRELGQKTFILDPWEEVNRRYGSKTGHNEQIAYFNPLSILNPTNDHYADDIAYIADALIINQGKDPHWDDSARELVAGMIAYAVEKYKELATLPLVRLMLSKPIEEIAGIAQDAQSFGVESVASRKLGRFVNESKELASIISTALTQTAFLDSAKLGENLSKSTFSFEQLVTEEKGASLFLVLPVDKLHTYGRWLRLMVSIGIRTLARNTRTLHLPVLFILDEFGTIGKLSAIVQAYGLMAGLQMCIWAFVQDLVQLKRDYPDEWESFIGNSESVTFSNVMDQFTAEYLSKLLGTTTEERISQATVEARQGRMFKAGDPNHSLMSDQIFARDLLQPSEIRTTPNKYGFLIHRSLPVMFVKFVYYENDFFAEHARRDPYNSIPKNYEKLIFDEATAIRFFGKYGVKVTKKGILKSTYEVAGPSRTRTFSLDELIVAARDYVKKKDEEKEGMGEQTDSIFVPVGIHAKIS